MHVYCSHVYLLYIKLFHNCLTIQNAKVERHVSHVKRMRRSTGKVCTVLCRFEEINVPFGAGIIYENKQISIVDTTTMAVLRR